MIPRTVAAAVLKLHELGEADSWAKFAMIGRYNAIRLVKARGLIEDANEEARHDAAHVPYEVDIADVWKRYPTRWRLTAKGRALVEELQR